MTTKRIGLALAALWAAWWVFFATAEAIASRRPGEAPFFILFMAGAVFLAWRWPPIGGTVLVLEGLISIAMYTSMWLRRFQPAMIVSLYAAMCAPPLVAGILLLISGRRAAHP